MKLLRIALESINDSGCSNNAPDYFSLETITQLHNSEMSKKFDIISNIQALESIVKQFDNPTANELKLINFASNVIYTNPIRNNVSLIALEQAGTIATEELVKNIKDIVINILKKFIEFINKIKRIFLNMFGIMDAEQERMNEEVNNIKDTDADGEKKDNSLKREVRLPACFINGSYGKNKSIITCSELISSINHILTITKKLSKFTNECYVIGDSFLKEVVNLETNQIKACKEKAINKYKDALEKYIKNEIQQDEMFPYGKTFNYNDGEFKLIHNELNFNQCNLKILISNDDIKIIAKHINSVVDECGELSFLGFFDSCIVTSNNLTRKINTKYSETDTKWAMENDRIRVVVNAISSVSSFITVNNHFLSDYNRVARDMCSSLERMID